MKRKKFVYVISSVIIGIVAIIFIFAGLAISGAIDAGTNKLIFKSASADKIYDGQALACDEWSIVDGSLKKGHTAKVVMLGEQTNAGVSENKFDVTITDTNGADVTGDYKIVAEYGSLTVRPFPLTIQSGSAEKDYDGTPLTLDEYTIESFRELLDGHEILVNITGSATSRDGKNKIADVRILADGVDVTHNYDITKIEGDLIIKGAPEGSEQLSSGGAGNQDDSALFYITTDATTGKKYNVIYLREKSLGNYAKSGWANPTLYQGETAVNPLYYSGLALSGGTSEPHTITVELAEESAFEELPYLVPYYVPNSMSADTSDSKLSYSGLTPYTVDEFYVYDYFAAKTPVGFSDEDAGYVTFVKKAYTALPQDTYDKMWEIIEKNEEIDPNSETLITDVANFVQNYLPYSLDITKEYTGDFAVFFFEEAENGFCQHFATAATAMYRALGIPARYTIGYAAMAYAGQRSPVTAKEYHAWVEVYMDGFGWVPVEVTGGMESSGGNTGGTSGGDTGNSESLNELVIKPKSIYKRISEENEVLTATDDIQSDMLAQLVSQGYSYTVTVKGSQTGVGKSHSEITHFQLLDPDKNDVTKQFKITYQKGVLQLYAYEITLTTFGLTEVYNGKAQSRGGDDDWNLSGELDLINNKTHIYSVVLKGSQTNVGSSSNVAEITLVDKDGKDITDHYKINKNFGALTVTLLEWEIVADSAEKVYDGAALTSDTYTYTGITIENGVIVETGHKIEINITGMQTEPGESANTVSEVVIKDEKGNDVTSNYGVAYKDGTLKVTPPRK